MNKNEISENNKNNEVHDIAVSVEKIMADFLEAMRLREELSIKIGRRTSQIIRTGSFTVTLLCVAMIYLTSSLNSDMKRMASRMDEIAVTMKSMDGSMTSVPAMSVSVGNMSRDVSEMTRQMYYLNGNVGAMGNDVNQMSAPMRMFPMP